MKWPAFLAQLEKHSSVTLVGPLIGAPHAPVEPTVYVDGGARFKPPENAGPPTITLGDGDSGGEMDETLPVEKDYSDLAFVLRELPKNIEQLHMHGFLGGRRDHELANLGEVHQFLRKRGQARADLYGEKLTVTGFCGQLQIDINGLFSLIAFEASAVLLQGECKYKLDGTTVLDRVSSHGLSNEGSGLVMVQSSKPVFIFLGEVS